ncbi:DNA-binding ferritin-like protein (Dps family) [Breznakia blatticola]|uniref:DNA-binding ferritin-like protein (Dps family) n=1 Tax=Breznakia blatticola TaxID=1754012 RepID=A0A4R7ZAT3_9FIRM|nr:DUF1048 domain-containing protein [Breznakia blatticola]TDW13189.1 DNA-binding ferritin-like protein (Dps family) [Breznakia blatticola]
MNEKMSIKNYIKEGLVSLKNIKKDKEEYRKYKARIEALPKDYKDVYEHVEKYLWSHADTSGHNAQQVIGGLLEMFEDGVAQGLSVKQITGDDVGEFADSLAKEIDHSWVNKEKEKLTKRFKD